MSDLYGPLNEKKKKRKKAGSESSKESSLRDWFGRKGAKGKKKGWVDCNSPDGKGGYKSCGRGSGEKRKKYPACRPTPGACKERGKGKSWGKKAKRKSRKNEELYMDLEQIIIEELENVLNEAAYEPGRAVAGIDTGEEHVSPEDLMRDEVQDLADKFGVEASIEIASDGKPVILVTHRNGETTPYDDTEEMHRDLSDEVGRRDFGDPDKYENEYEMSESILDEKRKKKKKKKKTKKDACYNKVKSRYKVWPSAYASGALVKCRKVGAKNWGNSKKESLQIMIEDEITQVLDEKKKKACKPSKGKRFAKRVNGKCRSYGQSGQAKSGGDRIRPGTKKGDAYCARSAKIKKCKNPPCANALSRKKWKCRGSKSMKE